MEEVAVCDDGLCKTVVVYAVLCIEALHVMSPRVIEQLKAAEVSEKSWLIAVAISSVRNVEAVMKVSLFFFFQYTSFYRVPGNKHQRIIIDEMPSMDLEH